MASSRVVAISFIDSAYERAKNPKEAKTNATTPTICPIPKTYTSNVTHTNKGIFLKNETIKHVIIRKDAKGFIIDIKIPSTTANIADINVLKIAMNNVSTIVEKFEIIPVKFGGKKLLPKKRANAGKAISTLKGFTCTYQKDITTITTTIKIEKLVFRIFLPL